MVPFSPIRRDQIAAYGIAVAVPLAIMVVGAVVGLPEFAFEDLTILIVVACTLRLGFGPGVPFRYTMTVARGSLTLDFKPDGAHEDLLSEPVAGTSIVAV